MQISREVTVGFESHTSSTGDINEKAIAMDQAQSLHELVSASVIGLLSSLTRRLLRHRIESRAGVCRQLGIGCETIIYLSASRIVVHSAYAGLLL